MAVLFILYHLLKYLIPPMNEFKLESVIPTSSESNCLFARNGLYFSSNTNLFKLENGKYTLVSSCDGTIRNFTVFGSYSLLSTDDRIYLNNNSHFIGSLRRSATALDICEDFFAIGTDNILEVWMIPKEFKFTLFTLHSKNVGHHKRITNIKIIDENRILTASEDCTIRLFDISTKKSKIIASLSDLPIGLHFDMKNNNVIATSKNGRVVIVNLDTMEFTNMEYEANISASVFEDDVFVLCLENMVIPKSQEDTLLLPDTKKELQLSDKTTIILFKEMEEIYRGEISEKILSVAYDNVKFFVRTSEFIGNYDFHGDSLISLLDIPKILNMNLFKNVLSTGCADRHIRIYRGNTCIANLFDSKSVGEIHSTHISSNICTAVYKTGYISSFNINDLHCFRSFQVSTEPLTVLSASTMSEDGCFLFLSDLSDIKVVDIIKCKLLETINLKSPIISMKYYRDYLYTIELDKTVSKINVFSGFIENILLEDIPTSISIKESSVVISTVQDILFYDLDLNFINSFSVTLEGRNRSEMYISPKSVECVGFTSEYVFCGGDCNTIKVFHRSDDPSGLMKSFLSQILRVSRNKDKENYKTKLMKEKDTKFDKENKIRALNIHSNEDKMYILSTEGISIYSKDIVEFSPLEFDVETTKDFVEASLQSGNYQKALISSLKQKDSSLVLKTIDNSDDIDFLIKHIPSKYAKILLEFSVGVLKQDFTNIKFIQMINKILFWHKIAYPGLLEILRNGTKSIYDNIKSNKYLIEAIDEKTEDS